MAYGNGNKGKTYYKMTSFAPPNEKSFQITKFNQDLDMESSYTINWMPSQGGGYYDCQCPASKFDCRHKDIMKRIRDTGEVNGSKFFCFETKTFHDMKEI